MTGEQIQQANNNWNDGKTIFQNITICHTPWETSHVRFEGVMSEDNFNRMVGKLAEPTRPPRLTPWWWEPQMGELPTYSITTTGPPVNVPVVNTDFTELLDGKSPLPPKQFIPNPDSRMKIKCTEEPKEKFIGMVEKYCDTCFLDKCDAEDDYDCRKCLERRVKWEIE